MSKAQLATIAVALVLIGVSVAVIVESMGFPAPMTVGAPGPARLPIIYAVALCGISIALIAASVFGRGEPELELKGSARAVGLMVWTAVYVFLVSQLGFLLASVPWLLLAAGVLGGRWRGALLAALALPATIYLVFAYLLNVPLP